MKLPIKKKYFDMIKAGNKNTEFRDAHITFICEETGEQLRKEVEYAEVMPTNRSFKHYKNEGVIEDDKVILFRLT